MILQAGSGSDPTGLMTREEARVIADRVLSFASGVDQARVNLISEWSGNTRFADGGITTSGGVTNTSVTITVTIGKRRASSSTNVLDEGSLKRTIELAATLAKLSPEDAELMPELGAQNYASIDAYVQRTARLDPEIRSGAVSRAIEAGRGGGEAGWRALHRRVSRSACPGSGHGDERRPVCLSPDHRRRFLDDGADRGRHRQWLGIGRGTRLGADRSGRDWPHHGPEGGGEPEPASARTGTFIPRCSNRRRSPTLVPLLAGALNARQADEGRGAFSKPGGGTRIGEKVMDERVTLYSDPADPAPARSAVRRRRAAALPHRLD